MGFPSKWCNWIRECIKCPSFSVLLNGTPTRYFKRNRGIRQGDPLSPFIFVMVMEFFSIYMHLASASEKIRPLKRSKQLHIPHILFAYDMLVFCRADKSSIKELNGIIKNLHLNTGLMINRDKSKVYFSRSCRNKNDLADILGVSISTIPSKYLGLPLTISYIKARHFAPLIDKCRSRVEGWMLKKLSFAGIVELIKTVLHNTLSYWALSFKLPESVIKELERL